MIKSGERIILAYFTDEISAIQTRQALYEANFTDIEISSFANTSNNSTKKYTSMVAKVYGGNYDNSIAPLLAADPSVSGMSYNIDNYLSYNYVLTMIVSNANYPTAISIIRQNGGRI